MRPTSLALLLLSAACDGPEVTVVPGKDWSDEDRVGTTPDFYDHVPKNVLMISVDTFRRDHVDHFSGGDLNPFLSSLAENGFSLDAHTQCSNWTYAGTVCTLRGAYNEENGFVPSLTARDTYPVPEGSEFLATWLGEAGYYSILVSGNTWLGPQWGSSQGYVEATNPGFGNASLLYEEGVSRLDKAIARGDAEKWFLHLHLMEPHAPYDPPAAYLGALDGLEPLPWDLALKEDHYLATMDWPELSAEDQALLEAHLRARYEAEIRYWDDQLKDIFFDLGARGLLEDTLVVFWNDHGEQFWEHGYQSHAYGLNGEENNAWVVFWAKNIVPGRWTEPTSAIDVAPTVLTLLDLPVPDVVTGLPVGTAPLDRPRYATSVARLGVVQMVRKDQYKLTYSWLGAARFYDTAADPLEENDLFDAGDPMVQELWSLMEPYAITTEPLAPQYPRTDPPGL